MWSELGAGTWRPPSPAGRSPFMRRWVGDSVLHPMRSPAHCGDHGLQSACGANGAPGDFDGIDRIEQFDRFDLFDYLDSFDSLDGNPRISCKTPCQTHVARSSCPCFMGGTPMPLILRLRQRVGTKCGDEAYPTKRGDIVRRQSVSAPSTTNHQPGCASGPTAQRTAASRL